MRRLALVLLAVCIAVAVAVLWHSHADAVTQDRDAILAHASVQHWAGTDDLGRDRAARLAVALLLGMGGAVCAAAITTAATVLVALGIVFSPAAWGRVMLYLSDLFLTLPWLFLLMLVRSALPLNLSAAACAAVTFALLAALGWPIYVRGLCARLQGMRRADWLLQARVSGLSNTRIAWRYIVPQLRPLCVAQFLICVPACILGEADLGAIGFGVSEPLVSWGTLLKDLGSAAGAAATPWVYAPMALLLAVLLCFEVLSVED